MISPNSALISRYRPLLAQRFGEPEWIVPAEGETFHPIPAGWYEPESHGHYIEVRKEGEVIRTVNCASLAEIEFVQ